MTSPSEGRAGRGERERVIHKGRLDRLRQSPDLAPVAARHSVHSSPSCLVRFGTFPDLHPATNYLPSPDTKAAFGIIPFKRFKRVTSA